MQVPKAFPALLGDGQGQYRVHIMGNSGKLNNIFNNLVEKSEHFKCSISQVLGRQVCSEFYLYDFFFIYVCLWTLIQSTASTALASILGVPLLSLDTVMWRPGWSQIPGDEFQAEVRSYMDQHQETGWVSDGDYMWGAGLLLHEKATDVVCEWFQ